MDDHEYLARLTQPDFLTALTQGHPPLHAGFILLFWPFVQAAQILGLNPIFIVKLGNSCLSLATVWLFWDLSRKLFNRHIASLAALLVALTPLFWIMAPTLLSESTYIFFFVTSLWSTQKYAVTKKVSWLLLSGMSFILAYLTHQVVLFFLPAYVTVMGKRKNSVPIPSLVLTVITGITIATLVLARLYQLRGLPFSQAVSYTLTSKLADRGDFSPFLPGLARAGRNWLILLFRSFSALLTILGALGLVKLWLKKPRLALALSLWFLPSLIAAQWWDGLLSGRYLLLSLFPLALTAAVLVKKQTWLKALLVVNVFIAGFGGILLLRLPLPAQIMQQTVKALPQNGLLIETHFFRPWIQYQGKLLLVNEPSWPQNFPEAIDDYLKNNQPVFITSQALADPYGVYTGSYLHPLSLSFRQPPKLDALTQTYRLTPVATPSARDHLTLYQITAETPQPGFRPDRVSLWHRRRLDFFDPVSRLWLWAQTLLKPDTIRA